MSTKTITTIITEALDHVHAYDAAIQQARELLKGKDRDTIKVTLLPIVAAYPKYAVPIVDGEGKAKGKKVMDGKHAKYKTASKALERLIDDIMGKAANKGEQYEIPEELLAAAVTLVKRARGYDEKVMRTLAAQALAHAWTL
jgi:hypothetical protein